MKNIPFWKNQLISKFVICLLLVMLIPFSLLLFMTSKKIADNEYSQTSETLANSLEVISLTADYRLSSIESMYITVLTDREFTNHIIKLEEHQSPMTYDDYLHVRAIKNTMTSLSVQNSDIRHVYLYCPVARRFFNSSINWDPSYNDCDFSDTAWYQSYLDAQNGHPWNITLSPIDEQKILSSYRTVEKPQLITSGILSINVDAETIVQIMASANPYDSSSFCILTDASGGYISTREIPEELLDAAFSSIGIPSVNSVDSDTDVVSDSGADSSFDTDSGYGADSSFVSDSGSISDSGATTFEYENQTYFLTFRQSEYSGFTYILGIAKSAMPSSSSSIRQLIIWYSLDVLFIIIIFIILAYIFFLHPIHTLATSMRKSQDGDFSVRLPETSNDEIGQINHRFNRMNQSIQELIDENYVKEIGKRTLELKLLSNQINEHFLYNILDSIHWIARRNHDTLVSRAVQSLAEFYRISLSCGSDTIRVSELKRMLENYLFLQKMRFDDILQYDITIDDTLLNCTVPKYLFIPLVENAISHGIKNETDGVVCVSLQRQENEILFRVSDNGCGISKERMEEILTAIREADFSNNDCFALKNLNMQLSLHFHDHPGIHLESTEGVGTVAWFTIPFS